MMSTKLFRCGCPQGYDGDWTMAGSWFWHGDNPEAKRWYPSHLRQRDGRVAGLKEWLDEIHEYECVRAIVDAIP